MNEKPTDCCTGNLTVTVVEPCPHCEAVSEPDFLYVKIAGSVERDALTGSKITRPTRRAFTVIELMIVISIIALLAAMAASALSNAAETAREQRTRAIVAKLDQLIMERWDGYRTRAVPYQHATSDDPRTRAQNRLNALRELQRMELPDRITDIVSQDTGNTMESPASGIAATSLFQGYWRKLNARTNNDPTKWTQQHQGAECLYLIVSSMRDGDQSALEYFTSAETGDMDGDGMPEILDGWGQPIEFLRWAPGYIGHFGIDGQWGVAGTDDDNDTVTDNISEFGWSGSDDQPIGTQQTLTTPDPFDPIKIGGAKNYALKPLIFSAGSDGEYDVNVNIRVKASQAAGTPMRYTGTSPPNNPYIADMATSISVGQVGDADSDGTQKWMDNITNHEI